MLSKLPFTLCLPLHENCQALYFSFVDKDPQFEGKIKGDMHSGYWLIAYFVFIFVMSFVGSYGPDSGSWIPAPWDTLVAGIGSLAFY